MSREKLIAALDEELRFQMGGAPGAWVEALTHVFTAVEAQGFKLVPVVATEEMGIACMKVRLAALDQAKEPRPSDIWTAMLTAAAATEPQK